MAIRLKDADSALGRMHPALAGASAEFEGFYSVAEVRIGTISDRLQNLVAQLAGVYAPSSAYSGHLAASLEGVWGTNAKPAVPTVFLVEVEPTSVTLEWALVEGATSYDILRGTATGGVANNDGVVIATVTAESGND